MICLVRWGGDDDEQEWKLRYFEKKSFFSHVLTSRGYGIGIGNLGNLTRFPPFPPSPRIVNHYRTPSSHVSNNSPISFPSSSPNSHSILFFSSGRISQLGLACFLSQLKSCISA